MCADRDLEFGRIMENQANIENIVHIFIENNFAFIFYRKK